MYKKIEKQILDFVKKYPAIDRYEIVHGTLYVKFTDDKRCDFFHRDMRNHYKENINTEGGVNMYAVGDEFAFDFVPEDRETPVFSDEEYSGKEGMMPDDIDKGIWSDFAEEGLMKDIPDDVDTLLELENEMKKGK
tara:strand:- start:586 stop:990 length:405 start_codon:yes stop_codon:yes gene_type:complete